MNNHMIEKTIELRLNRVKQRVANAEHYNSDEHTFHGGWTQGYWQGQLSVLEDLQDLLEDMREEDVRMREEQSRLNQMLMSSMQNTDK